MKFGKYFRSHQIPEWQEYYIDYNLLKSVINGLKKYTIKKNKSEPVVAVRPPEIEAEIKLIIETFQKLLILQFKHFSKCFKFEFKMIAKIKLVKIIWNFAVIDAKCNKKDVPTKMYQIKNMLEMYFKELIALRDFVNLNFRCIYKILKKFKKISEGVNEYDSGFSVVFGKLVLKSFVYQHSISLLKAIKVVETLYIDKFAKDQNSNRTQSKLNRIAQKQSLTYTEIFKTGIFIGLFIVFILILIFQTILTKFFTLASTDLFLVYQFNIFRGSISLFLYMLFWGINVYVFEKFNINYTRVLDFGLYYSTPFQLWNRAFFFLLFWILIYLYCSIANYFETTDLDTDHAFSSINNLFSMSVSTYIPPIVYFIFILYMIFPHPRWLNGRGRIWFFQLSFKIIISPFYDFPFIVPWATDQLLSLTISLRDFWYAFCYFVNACSTGKVSNDCRPGSINITEYVVIFIPLGLRILQCLNRVYFNKTRKEKLVQLFNCLKYITSSISTVLSFYQSNNVIFVLWIIFVVISSLYSFFWDLKYDWAFLQKGSSNFLLRSQLSYPYKWFYYVIILANFVMRFAWTLSISSHSFIQQLSIRHFVSLLLAIVENFRRSCWNYIRIEVEHIKTIGAFSIFHHFELPYEFNIDLSDAKLINLLNKEFHKAMTSIELGNQKEFVIDRDFQISKVEENAEDFLRTHKLEISPESSHNSASEEMEDLKKTQEAYRKKLAETQELLKKPQSSRSIDSMPIYPFKKYYSENLDAQNKESLDKEEIQKIKNKLMGQDSQVPLINSDPKPEDATLSQQVSNKSNNFPINPEVSIANQPSIQRNFEEDRLIKINAIKPTQPTTNQQKTDENNLHKVKVKEAIQQLPSNIQQTIRLKNTDHISNTPSNHPDKLRSLENVEVYKKEKKPAETIDLKEIIHLQSQKEEMPFLAYLKQQTKMYQKIGPSNFITVNNI